MKKTTFTKLLALVVAVLVIAASLTAGFGAFAAAPADSEADYYDVNGKGVLGTSVQFPHHLKPLDEPGNLDFEDGYRYWSGKDSRYGKDVFEIVTEGGNSYAKIPASGYVTYLQSALIKLNGVTAGDNIVVVYDVKGARGTDLRIKVEQEFVKSNAVFDETTGLVTVMKADGSALMNVTPGTPHVIVPTGRPSTEFDVQLGGEGWTTLVSPFDNKLIAPIGSPADASTGDPIADAYYIQIRATLGDSGVAVGDIVDAAIDNIRIAKVVEGVYTDVATGEVIYDPNGTTPPPAGDDDDQGTTPPPAGDDDDDQGTTPPPAGDDDDDQGTTPPPAGDDDQGTTPPPAPKYPAYYGTEDKGFNSQYSSFPVPLKPYDKITNLDFTDGFIFWSGQKWNGAADTLVYASDCFKLAEENGNKYVTLKDEGYTKSIQTAFFKVDAKVGDKVVLIYDAKGADATKLRPYLVQDGLRPVNYEEDTGLNTNTPHPTEAGKNWNASAGVQSQVVGDSVAPSEYKYQTGAAGWTTYVTINSIPIKAPADLTSGATDDIYLQVRISRGSATESNFDAAVDNIRIAKVVDGKYIDLATGQEITDAAGGSGSGTGTGTGTGTGSNSGTANPMGDSVLMLAALFFISGAAVFGTAKALKKSR